LARRKLKILGLLTRNPFDRASGRKGVLKTIIRSLNELGHRLDLVIFDKTRPKNIPYSGYVDWVQPPSLIEVAINLLRFFSQDRMSMNECLYFSKRNLQRIKEVSYRRDHDIVIADMIRTAPYACHLGVPWYLDLDDLLSTRYARYSLNRTAGKHFLGYYGDWVPKILGKSMNHLMRYLIKKEIKVLSLQEIKWAKRAALVSLVSNEEAAALEEMINKPVLCMPMSVAVPSRILFKGPLDRSSNAVFLGGLDYQPNLDALRFFHHNVRPWLESLGNNRFALDVIGFCPEAVRKEFESSCIKFRGYADNLYEELSQYSLFLAPIVSGSGVKTKVLEAMAVGLPVLTTSNGVSGLQLKDGFHCVIRDKPEEIARMIISMMSNQDFLQYLSVNGYHYVLENYSFDVMKRRWEKALDLMMEKRILAE
jgi:glycosyltransferase involved in cell wall biosynthesis